MARVLLGVSGGIAAYKALEFVRLATKAGHAVRVVQTPTSERFVGKASFAGLTGAPVLTDEFERDPARGAFRDQPPPEHDPLSHLELVRNADAFLVAPASANTIAKLAHGLADNLLTSAALAATCPVLVAPGDEQRDVRERRDAGEPRHAARARDHGARSGRRRAGLQARVGRRAGLPSRPTCSLRSRPSCPAGRGPGTGCKVLVTAGGTREAIDSVRYVGNRSSGRMGFALAEEAAARGADVTVVAANVGAAAPSARALRRRRERADLLAACEREFAAADVLLMAAAVADFRPAQAAADKLKKEGRDAPRAGARADARRPERPRRAAAPGQVLVGSPPSTAREPSSTAAASCERKGLDAVVVNDISRADIGFDGDAQRGDDRDRERRPSTVERASKAEVARAICDAVLRYVRR